MIQLQPTIPVHRLKTRQQLTVYLHHQKVNQQRANLQKANLTINQLSPHRIKLIKLPKVVMRLFLKHQLKIQHLLLTQPQVYLKSLPHQQTKSKLLQPQPSK